MRARLTANEMKSRIDALHGLVKRWLDRRMDRVASLLRTRGLSSGQRIAMAILPPGLMAIQSTDLVDYYGTANVANSCKVWARPEAGETS